MRGVDEWENNTPEIKAKISFYFGGRTRSLKILREGLSGQL